MSNSEGHSETFSLQKFEVPEDVRNAKLHGELIVGNHGFSGGIHSKCPAKALIFRTKNM